MDTYIKTIINGLKSWVSSRLTRLETSVSGSLADLANKLTSLSNKVSKNTKDIAQLQTYEDETYSIATAARSTATAAQSTATAAQTKADNAKSTADAAQSMADNARTTATAAQTKADNAKSTADAAQSMADNARTTANAAQSMADNALQKSGGNMTGPLRMNGNVVINENGEIIAARSLGIYPKDYTQSFGSFLIVKDPDAKTMVWVDRDSVSGTGAPSTIKFIANGSAKMNVEGIHTIQMNSPSGKKFDITVSDDGTITTTEVTA